MSMTVKDVIKWLKTLSADDAIYVDEGGLTLMSENDPDAYLEVGGFQEEPVFETHYSVSPRYNDKMQKVFDRYGLDWNPEERDDAGDMAGTVSGDRESVIKFVMDTWKVSRKKALGQIRKKEDEE